ncbi:ADP-ribosylation factor GTPase-activating protein [Skeletonema marinoi]|uniref:ADP-ribosylation factor GTPase-activating protein n=1 Tax=Skeletonema marinoi TaxID=267567 RepID=A0AAD8XWX5_9STRA|nr:ADP-ribosylation factor GTPase-activating protein [Skeletonema marinoi]
MPPYSSTSTNSDWASSSSSSRGSQPKAALHLSSSSKTNELLQLVAQELETMKQPPKQQSTKPAAAEQSFPPACLRLMSSLPGNLTCIDCHSRTDISWASVSFGCLMCLQCSGKHRSLGVQTSFVKSVSMDGWKVHEVLSMLEGGNEQLDQFFERHEMGKSVTASGDGNNRINPTSPTASGTILDRYKTKAASFYRQHLINHAKELGEGGVYKGREASRSKNKKKSYPSASSSRKHQRNQQQQQPSKPKLLPTVTESSASLAESETATSPPLSPSSQQQPLKRQRSEGKADVSMEMSDLDLDRME